MQGQNHSSKGGAAYRMSCEYGICHDMNNSNGYGNGRFHEMSSDPAQEELCSVEYDDNDDWESPDQDYYSTRSGQRLEHEIDEVNMAGELNYSSGEDEQSADDGDIRRAGNRRAIASQFLHFMRIDEENHANLVARKEQQHKDERVTYGHLSYSRSLVLNSMLARMESNPVSKARLIELKGSVSCSANSNDSLYTEMYRFNAPVGERFLCYGGTKTDTKPVWVSTFLGKSRSSVPEDPLDLVARIADAMNSGATLASTWLPDSYTSNATFASQGDVEDTTGMNVFLTVANALVSSYLSRNRSSVNVDGNADLKVSLVLKQSFLGSGLCNLSRNNHSYYIYPNISHFYVLPHHKTYRNEFVGFLDPINVSAGASGGCNRHICSGVEVRIWNNSTHMSLIALLALFNSHCRDCGSAKTHALMLDHMSYRCCICSLNAISHWAASRIPSRDNCTLHYFKASRSMRVSYCSGALVRNTASGYLDNLMANGDYLEFSQPHNFTLDEKVSRIALWCPFGEFLPEARVSLMEGFLSQAVCNPYGNIVAKVTPLYNQWPVFLTGETSKIVKHCFSMGIEECPVPGLNVRVAFVNAGHMTYEDGMVMSQSCAERFRYKRVTCVTVSSYEGKSLRIGTIIAPHGKIYWPLPVEGKVICVRYDSSDRAHVEIEREQHAVTGDKFTTTHGQKSVITVVADDMMPRIARQDFRIELIMGLTGLVKRCTPSQLLEATYSQEFLDSYHALRLKDANDSDMPGNDGLNHRVCPDRDFTKTEAFMVERDEIINRFESNCLFPSGHGILREEFTPISSRGIAVSGDKPIGDRKVMGSKCNYGTIRLMQSPFMTNDKLHYTRVASRESNRLCSRGKQMGGSVSIGEMEIQQIAGNGMSSVLKELTMKSDLVTVLRCNRCRCLSMMCDCEPCYDSNGMRIECRDVGLFSLRYSFLALMMVTYQRDDMVFELF